MKKKLLFYGDTPTGTTGFSTVSKNILKRLHETGEYEITVVGINYFGDPHDLPYKIYPAAFSGNGDLHGKQFLLDKLRNLKNDFDILFTLQDTFIMSMGGFGEMIAQIRDGKFEMKRMEDGTTRKVEVQKGRGFKWIFYYPIDSTPKKEWIEGSVKLADVAVPYTNFAMEKSRIYADRDYSVIYHGFDRDTFHPLTEEEKDEFRKKHFSNHDLKNKFLIVNVNRNQERKGMLQTLLAFRMFQTLVPNSILYTHCNVLNDRGGNMIEMAEQLGIENNWIYPNPEIYAMDIDIPAEFINGVLNIADVNISTTLGEGFGLSLIESMAAGTLNIFPNNTAIRELLADNRGILVKSGSDLNTITCNGPFDNNRIRPTVDVYEMVNALVWAYRSPERKAEIEAEAMKWANENCDWDILVNKFHDLIKKSL